MSLTAAGAPKLFSSLSFSSCLQAATLNSKPRGTKLMSSPKLFLTTPNLSSNSGVRKWSYAIRTSNSQGQEEKEEEESPSNSFSKEDVTYLLKLGAGSVAGAAVIKFGSILYPEITRPNLLQALIMISMPVVAAVVLLFNQSRSQ